MGWVEIGLLIVRLLLALPSIITTIKEIMDFIRSLKEPHQSAERQAFSRVLHDGLSMAARGDKRTCGVLLRKFLDAVKARHAANPTA